MKIIFVTANLPHGTDEAFIVPEIDQLIRDGHQVLIVPRSPNGLVIHGKDVLKHSKSEALCSATVMKKAVRVAASALDRTLRALAPIFIQQDAGDRSQECVHRAQGPVVGGDRPRVGSRTSAFTLGGNHRHLDDDR